MVTDPAAKELAQRTLRHWVAAQPGGSVSLAESEVPYESVARVVPRNTAAAQVEFRIGDYGTFGLYIGTALRIEELPLSSAYLLEILEAVAHGAVEEEFWRCNQQVLRATTRLRLPSGDLDGTAYLSPFGIGEHSEYERKAFESY